MSIQKVVEPAQGNEPPTARITGVLRVRAKTEGMALCVGERCKTNKWVWL